jgi:scyllo-inositol 2-dehydrogenase (NADP+)
MTINVALLGYGLAGAYFHALLISVEPRLRLAHAVTTRADQVRRDFPDAKVSNDANAAIEADDIDLVVIATPNKTHAPLARRALLAGKHVVVDKPLVGDAAEGADLIELAHRQGRMLTVFHNRRWDGDFLTVSKLVGDGRLGEINHAELRWDRFRLEIRDGWREVPDEGNGLLADLGPHLIDQALQLFGIPDRIMGDVAQQRAGALVDDYFELTLHYGPRRVILSASTLIAEPRPRFALHGNAGSFVKHGIDPQEAFLRGGGSPLDTEYGFEAVADHGQLTDVTGRHHVSTERGDWPTFYRLVADAVADGAPPPVDPRDAVMGLEIMECARRSAREGCLLRFQPTGDPRA